MRAPASAHKKVLVLGDSHATVFKEINRRGLSGRFHFDVCSVQGATVSGLKNPNSITKASSIYKFRSLLNRWFDYLILVHLGAVDCGGLIWKKVEQENLTIEQAEEYLLNAYASFIRTLELYGFAGITVMSIPLPTIGDAATASHGAVALQRKGIRTNQRVRTEFTLKMNDRLRRFTEKHGHEFLNFDYCLDSQQKVVSSMNKNSDPLDHHYEIGV